MEQSGNKLFGAEKLNVKNKNDIYFFKFEIFCEIHLPTRHIKYKVIDFAPSNKSIMAKKLPSNNLDFFLRRIK